MFSLELSRNPALLNWNHHDFDRSQAKVPYIPSFYQDIRSAMFAELIRGLVSSRRYILWSSGQSTTRDVSDAPVSYNTAELGR